MSRRIRLVGVFLALISVCFGAQCMRQREEVCMQNGGQSQAPDPAMQAWLERLDSLQSDYVRRLYDVYNDTATPESAKIMVATRLAREGETLPLEWLVKQRARSGFWVGLQYYYGILSVPAEDRLLFKLVHSNSPDQQIAAAMIMESLMQPGHAQLLEHIMEGRESERDSLAVPTLKALAANLPWKKSMPTIAHVSRTDASPALKHAAQVALARMIGEPGFMSVGEFRKYVRARLDELPDE